MYRACGRERAYSWSVCSVVYGPGHRECYREEVGVNAVFGVASMKRRTGRQIGTLVDLVALHGFGNIIMQSRVLLIDVAACTHTLIDPSSLELERGRSRLAAYVTHRRPSPIERPQPRVDSETA